MQGENGGTNSGLVFDRWKTGGSKQSRGAEELNTSQFDHVNDVQIPTEQKALQVLPCKWNRWSIAFLRGPSIFQID